MTLDRARPGAQLRIEHIADAYFRMQALRMGLGEGEIVSCADVVPGGPVLVRRHSQTVAVGRGLAKTISIATL